MMMTSRYHFFLLFGCLFFSVISCTSVYFNQPQPIDSKNLNRIPKKFRGTWVQKNDTIIIGKRFYQKTGWYFNTISKVEIDTNKSLQIRGQRIYDLEEPSSKGFEFTAVNDSLIIRHAERFKFTLGDSAQLRSVSKKYSIINLKKDSIWWDVFLIERKDNGEIIVKNTKKDELKILEALLNTNEIEIAAKDKKTTLESRKNWNVGLTSKQMIKFINMGGFSETTLVLKPDEKTHK
ncbi:hypothetical protein [Gaetbulibacter saemankumensis]|uniref:hypothetical protein n=1 Tax=Gaetbulibacter saemankumensis TaxID=311208 RepID=UPI0012F8B03A|nr:hypothetical protein [Gaetbulibacter saemankumensis]